MELEEMKNLWQEMSSEIQKQKTLTDKMILEMTQQKYRSKLQHIRVPEIIATFVCFGAAGLIIWNFSAFDTWYLMAFAFASVSLLLLMPVLSLRAINRMQRLNVAEKSYRETLQEFAKRKAHFLGVQRLSFYLGFLLLVAILPVFSKMMGGKDIMQSGGLGLWAVILGLVCFLFFARWVYRAYKGVANQAATILEELEN